MKASEWIDRVKKATGTESDYGVAKALGLSRATVSKYRHGTPTLDEESAVKVANLLGEQPEVILLDQIVERSKSTEARSALQRVLKGLSGVAAGLLVAVGLTSAPAPGHASQGDQADSVYYVK